MARSPYKDTPEYSEGFYAELEGAAIESECPGYQAGVEAAKNVRGIMADHGMSDNKDGSFSISIK